MQMSFWQKLLKPHEHQISIEIMANNHHKSMKIGREVCFGKI